ncbi:hypothetical protein [uncultured Tolumonas sp.]|uniref:hypothetical protein n=1 Tax=uncultured Tolumonas sp. TaxID=263765 RepID=UPI002A0A5980|nr:hypothetical protein [uncultured Tolumonas sp.]
MNNELNNMEKRCVSRHNDLAKHFNAMSQQHTQMLNRENIAAAKEIVSHVYSQANTYSNFIIAAGYVGFFSLWSSIKPDLPEWAILSSGCLILVSLLIFIGFELYKMISAAIQMHKVSKRLHNPNANTLNDIQLIQQKCSLSNARIWVFTVIPTVLFGLGAGIILLYCFVVEFISQLPKT